MEQYVKRTQRDYSMSFKLSVIRQIEQGELTYIEAAKHYGIQSPQPYSTGYANTAACIGVRLAHHLSGVQAL